MIQKIKTSANTKIIKLALPKGDLLDPTSNLLHKACMGLSNYSPDTRYYHINSEVLPNISAKIFHEKNIPIQVAIGNYDIGICGHDWIEELLSKYPQSPIIEVLDLNYGLRELKLLTHKLTGISKLEDLYISKDIIRIASEYPNISEKTAIELRLKRFKIFSVWGAVENYPPENSDLIIIKTEDNFVHNDNSFVSIRTILNTSARLIVNKESWQTKNLKNVISRIASAVNTDDENTKKPKYVKFVSGTKDIEPIYKSDKFIRIALPDGHQMRHTSNFLRSCGLEFEGYSPENLLPRPVSYTEWIKAKVIRPQDMPIQVANNNFDLAITGIDWYLDHKYRFPSSPVTKLLDLNYGRVKIVAVVSENCPFENIESIKLYVNKRNDVILRVASEYINIADRYMTTNHIKRYKIIPTWGATEALIPEDADILIENTETGKTLALHRLKIIDTLFDSAACIICNTNSLKNRNIKNMIDNLIYKINKTG